VPGRIGEHRLEALAGRALALAFVLCGRAGPLETLDEVVAQALQVGEADDAPLRCPFRRGSGMRRIGGEAPFESRDLIAQGAARGPFVSTLERRDLGDLEGGGRGRQVAASRVEDAGQVTGVDPLVPGRRRGRRGELLDRRRR
jgi:hypothetical protein